MRLAAARGDVEHDLGTASRRARRGLRSLHRGEPGAPRGGAGRPIAPPTESCRHDAAKPRPDRRHRRRHHRLFDGLSPGARPQGRRGAARTGQADLGLDLACRRPRRAAALLGLDHPGAEIFGRPLQAARGRDRPGDRLEDDRLPAARHQPGPLDRVQAAGDDGEELRHGHAAGVAGRGEEDVAADGDLRPRRRLLAADRRTGEPLRHHPVAGQGRAHAWREAPRGGARHRLRDERQAASPP